MELRQMQILAVWLAGVLLTGCSLQPEKTSVSWNARAAAAYLDQRESSWIAWPAAVREQNTFCISCHTVLPYALARPALREVLGEQQPTEDERKIIDDVEKRVRLWSELGPYYTEQGYGKDKPTQSRGTEAILNALILATLDARTGHLSDTTGTAFSEMWALQLSSGDNKGAWPWLQFNMEPWEAADSQFYGAALAAIAVGTAPEGYRSSADIQDHVRQLRGYLTLNAAKQSLMNRVVLLWASTKLTGLLGLPEKVAIVHEIFRAQEADGGWELSSRAWPGGWSFHRLRRTYFRTDWTRQNQSSDGYATGLITFVLQEAGVSRQDPRLKRAFAWLAQNQSSSDGSWPSVSLSVRRNSSSNVGHFMSDAATAYTVLALTDNEATSNINSGAKNTSESSPTQFVRGARQKVEKAR